MGKKTISKASQILCRGLRLVLSMSLLQPSPGCYLVGKELLCLGLAGWLISG